MVCDMLCTLVWLVFWVSLARLLSVIILMPRRLERAHAEARLGFDHADRVFVQAAHVYREADHGRRHVVVFSELVDCGVHLIA